MADRMDKDEGARAAGAADDPADGATGAVPPRAAGASAGGVGSAAAGQGGGKASGARARLIGHNQSLFTHGAGRRSRSRKAAGEPDGVLWAQLTPRDRVVLELVAEHHVLTTEQLRALLFPSISRAQHRLLALIDAGVLWRTQPYRAEGGSKPFHYLLGYRGAELLAAQRGSAPPRPATHADRLRRILESPRLGHLLGVNQFFAELGEHARRTGLGTFGDDERGFDREGLHTWRGEQWITNFYERTITPDGYGCWHERGGWLGFFLEHDTGTEPIYKVADKIDRYTSSERSGDPWDVARRLAGMVLIWTSSTRRENLLRRSLQAKGSPVPVATASREHGHPDGPAGEVWSVVTTEPEMARRVRLGALPAVIGGTTDTGTPSVLANLARQPTPVPAPPAAAVESGAGDALVVAEPDDATASPMTARRGWPRSA